MIRPGAVLDSESRDRRAQTFLSVLRDQFHSISYPFWTPGVQRESWQMILLRISKRSWGLTLMQTPSNLPGPPFGIGQSDLVPAEPAGYLRPNPVTVQIQGLNSGKKGNVHFYHAAFRQSTAGMVT
jgi:hypothetical protein